MLPYEAHSNYEKEEALRDWYDAILEQLAGSPQP